MPHAFTFEWFVGTWQGTRTKECSCQPGGAVSPCRHHTAPWPDLRCLQVLERERVEQVDQQLLAVVPHAGVGAVHIDQAEVQQLQGQGRVEGEGQGRLVKYGC